MEQIIKPFTKMEHRVLSNKRNHKIALTKDNEVIWLRRVGKQWERNMGSKEFKDIKQANYWLRDTIKEHYKKSFIPKSKKV